MDEVRNGRLQRRFPSRFHGFAKWTSLYGAVFRRVFIVGGWLSELTLGETVARTVLEVARPLLERWHNVLRARTGLIRKCLTLVKSGPSIGRVPHRETAINASSNTDLRGHLVSFCEYYNPPGEKDALTPAIVVISFPPARSCT